VNPVVECVRLSVGHGDVPVLTDLDLSVAPGEMMALLGASGSGKSTLLHAIAGFLAPLAGEIRLGGRPASTLRHHTPPEHRRVGLVFQDYALWPHLSALDTVAYPYRRRGVSRAAARQRARELLAGMGLAGLAGRRPAQLSGGEQQRVGLARALAGEPLVYLFDEPTAHLDAHLRTQVLSEVAQRRAATGAAALYATHDYAEAMAIAHRVAVLDGGRAAQIGTPVEVYDRPVNLDVARLTGPVSVLRAPVHRSGDTATADIGGVPVAVAGAGSDVLVRPDWGSIGGELPGKVALVRFSGPHTDYHLDTPAGTVVIREAGQPRLAVGDVSGWTLRRGWLV
jgi:ABC-type Fe3+/spermidine/putrescine transport system ATPase subunit